MADTDANITIDISGNTAAMATDYNTSGVGLTGAHVQIVKIAWGDPDNTERVTSNRPLPVQIQGGTGPIEVDVVTNGLTYIQNRIYGSNAVQYLAISGNTSGTSPAYVSGPVYGIIGATAIGVTGSVSIRQGTEVYMAGFSASQYVGSLFSGYDSQNTTTGATYARFFPVAITGGRQLHHTTDSIRLDNTIVGVSGGRELTAATDSVSIYGPGGGLYIHSILHGSNGTTLGISGDALKVSIVDATISATVNVSSVHGVTNATEPPLRVQGYTGSNHTPLTVQGEYGGGAIAITTSEALNTNITNTITIDDSNIVNALTLNEKPIVSNLTKITSNTGVLHGIKSDITSGRIRATVTINPPDALVSGHIQVSQAVTQLTSSTSLNYGVTIQNSVASNNSVVVGGVSLGRSANNGISLDPGESLFISIDNLNKVYVKSNGSSMVSYIGS